MKSDKNKKIMLCKLFSGSYGAEPGVIPHEVINLYEADNKKVYMYIAPYGGYCIDSHNVSHYLFVTPTTGGCQRVLFKVNAEDVHFIRNAANLGGIRPTSIADEKYIETEIMKRNIKYGGQYLFDVLPERNVWLVTFEASHVYEPVIPTIIEWNGLEEGIKLCSDGLEHIVINGGHIYHHYRFMSNSHIEQMCNNPLKWNECKLPFVKPGTVKKVQDEFENTVVAYKSRLRQYY